MRRIQSKPSVLLLTLAATLAIFAANSEMLNAQSSLIQIDDFTDNKPVSNKVLKLQQVKVKKPTSNSVIDEAKLNNGIRISLRESGLFRQILEPWQNRDEMITVDVLAEERDPVARRNNQIQFHLREGLEIPLPGNRPTYNLDGELKILMRFVALNQTFEFTCWTTSDYDAWRGDYSVERKLGQRLIADCMNELLAKIKANTKFMQLISEP